MRVPIGRLGTGVQGAVLSALMICAAGCPSPAERHRVNPDLARQTLQGVLESWRDGSTPASWQQKSPAVVVQDMDWLGGAQLESFEILEGAEAIDANLHCPVKLVLKTPDGGSVERRVTYLVGTSPVLTVFRAMGP